MKGTKWQEWRPHIGEVWRLSLPAILTQITSIVMQYIDSAMVGALGAKASAAIGLVASSTWLFNGVTYAVSAGFSVQVAHHIGGKEPEKARNVERHGLVAAILLSGLLCLLGILIRMAGRGDRHSKGCFRLFFYAFADASVFPAELFMLRLFAVQRGYGHAQRFKRCHVRTGCAIQRFVHSEVWGAGSRNGDGAGLCCYQPDHGRVVLP